MENNGFEPVDIMIDMHIIILNHHTKYPLSVFSYPLKILLY